MSATTDTRSIGQVLYETIHVGRYCPWLRLNSVDRDRYERAAEVIFKRGHDARGKEERALTPKAKQYRDALRRFITARDDPRWNQPLGAEVDSELHEEHRLALIDLYRLAGIATNPSPEEFR